MNARTFSLLVLVLIREVRALLACACACACGSRTSPWTNWLLGLSKCNLVADLLNCIEAQWTSDNLLFFKKEKRKNWNNKKNNGTLVGVVFSFYPRTDLAWLQQSTDGRPASPSRSSPRSAEGQQHTTSNEYKGHCVDCIATISWLSF